MSTLTNDSLAKKLIFLPGALGNIKLWKPVSDGLYHPGQREFFAWPGFGGVPLESDVNSIAFLLQHKTICLA